MIKTWNTHRASIKLLIVSNFIFILFGTYVFIGTSRLSADDGKKNSKVTTQYQIAEDSVNLTVDAFYSSFTSPSESTRQKAMIYLIGVLDATEGKSWCDYHTLKTISIREYLFEYIKKLPKHRLNERASKVIEEALNKAFNCRGQK